MPDPTIYRVVFNKVTSAVTSFAPDNGGTFWAKDHSQFTGTQDFCDAKIKQLNLTLPPDPALVAAKTAKLAALAKAFALPVTVSGISLGTDGPTQVLLNHFITALQLALSQQPDAAHVAGLNSTNISTLIGPLIDSTGAQHDMTVQAALALMLGYIQSYGSARAAYLTNVAAVSAATTVDAVNAVGTAS